jgi:hypothetical protein
VVDPRSEDRWESLGLHPHPFADVQSPDERVLPFDPPQLPPAPLQAYREDLELGRELSDLYRDD